MSDKILKIVGRYIYDSRGNPTVEVDLWTSKGNRDIDEFNKKKFSRKATKISSSFSSSTVRTVLWKERISFWSNKTFIFIFDYLAIVSW